jgi:hypothetical protein
MATLSGFFGYLSIIGAVASNPVPRRLSTRRRGRRGRVPLMRTPRTLPKVLEPGEVNALLRALRPWGDRAMVEAMVLGGLRRPRNDGCSSPMAGAAPPGRTDLDGLAATLREAALKGRECEITDCSEVVIVPR